MNIPGGGGTFCFWVGSIAGVSIWGTSGSEEMETRGLELMMAVTSAIRVHKTLWVKLLEGVRISIESKILLATPIMHSHTPPMCEDWGWLNCHVHPLLLVYLWTSDSDTTFWNSNSLLAPTKLVPQPFLKELMNEEVSKDSHFYVVFTCAHAREENSPTLLLCTWLLLPKDRKYPHQCR